MVMEALAQITSQEIASWVFGGLAFGFLLVVFVIGPQRIPFWKQQIIALIESLLAGLFGFFLTGTVAIANTGIQAVGGCGLFVFVLLLWRFKEKSRRKNREREGGTRVPRKIIITLEVMTILIGIMIAAIALPVIESSRQTLSAFAYASGKSLGNTDSVRVMEKYHPSGLMGDIGDIEDGVERGVGVDRFIYEAKGKGPHEYEFKYINGELSDIPAKFAGVMYLDPPSNFATVYGGFDLRRVRGVVKWEGRSIGGDVVVEFVVGGIDWVWDENNKKRVSPRYPDSMRRTSLGIKKLTNDWQSFEYPISQVPENNFRRVVGGFGWVINWGSNGVRANEDRTGPEEVKTFTIELRNIRYERR